MDVTQAARALLEHSLRHLKFDDQLAFLASIASTGKIAALPHRSSEDGFAYREALEKLAPLITPQVAQSVANSLVVDLTRREIDSRVAELRTANRPQRKPRNAKSISNRGPQKLVVGTESALRADELAEFVTLFDRAYAFGILRPRKDVQQSGAGRVLPNRESLVEELSNYSSALRVEKQASSLIILKIRKSSPLTLWFDALVTALVVAVVISGGEVDLRKGKFKVNSLGDGLKKLRGAFTPSQNHALKKRKRAQRR